MSGDASVTRASPERTGPWLGVVADDVTGAVDLAGEVHAAGLATVVVLGGPGPDDGLPGCDAAVVALTSRTAPVERAVAESVTSARWLLGHGARRLYQKYCSTFDSTDAGNIGPVADALADLVGATPGRSTARAALTIGTPATPAVGRTQYLGHLFVGDRLLSESSMRDHPLTPMCDPDLVRVLGRQTDRRVGLVPLGDVRTGSARVAEVLRSLLADGVAHVLVDATEDADLDVVASALPDHGVLLGGGAGLATALARRHGRTASGTTATAPPVGPGRRLVVAGSCSERTREQVARHDGPRLRLRATELADDPAGVVERAVAFARAAWEADPDAVPLVHSTAAPAEVRAEQDAVGATRAAALVEDALGEVARHAVAAGARRLIVAGGETSGAVSGALGVRTLHLAARVEPGLSWTVTTADPPVALLLKSGNFGSPDLFATAWRAAP